MSYINAIDHFKTRNQSHTNQKKLVISSRRFFVMFKVVKTAFPWLFVDLDKAHSWSLTTIRSILDEFLLRHIIRMKLYYVTRAKLTQFSLSILQKQPLGHDFRSPLLKES